MNERTTFTLNGPDRTYQLTENDIMTVARERLYNGWSTSEVASTLPISRRSVGAIKANITRAVYQLNR